jgi:hypothetical protein
MEPLFAEDAIILFFPLKASLIQDADGQVLMKASQMQ